MVTLQEMEKNTKQLITKLYAEEQKINDYLKNQIQQLLNSYLDQVQHDENKNSLEIKKLIDTAKAQLERFPTYESTIENATDEILTEMRKHLSNTHNNLNHGKVQDYRKSLDTVVHCAVNIEKSTQNLNSNQQHELRQMLIRLFLCTPPQKALGTLETNMNILNNVSEKISSLNIQNVDVGELERIQHQLEQVLSKLKTIHDISVQTIGEINQNINQGTTV